MMIVTAGNAEPGVVAAAPELFPLAGQLWMHSLDLTPQEHDAIEHAISEPTSWFCNKPGAGCAARARVGAGQGHNDGMLVAIRNYLAYASTAITVWSPLDGLRYNPTLVGHEITNTNRWITSKRIPHVEPPPMLSAPMQRPQQMPQTPPMAPPTLQCDPSEIPSPSPEGELQVIVKWPTPAEAGEFQYLAVADECNNVVVTRFAREVSVPVDVEPTEACSMNGFSRGPLKLLGKGTTLRVSAFNVDHAPTRSNVVSATFRVDIPNLQTAANGSRAPMLMPDLGPGDIRVECNPARENLAKAKPIDQCPHRPGQALASQSFVIRPDPLQKGMCRVVINTPLLPRFVSAPLLLHVTVERIDLPAEAQNRKLVDDPWLVVNGPGREFVIPHLPIDGDSRLRLIVSSDPADGSGTAILFTDALRGVHPWQGAESVGFRRDIASASVTTAALCGSWEFEPLGKVGSCLRAYVTIPIMLANFQVTRAPWIEKPILDPSVPGGIGVALAVDSYNPGKQEAFPLSVQLGGAFQRLTASKNGILTYLGIMPSLPVLGSGGTTTSIGLLLGGGVTYVIDSAGPNEGFKPAAFGAVVIGTGQIGRTSLFQ